MNYDRVHPYRPDNPNALLKRKSVEQDKIRSTIENAISVAVHEIRLPGIDGTDVRTVNIPLAQLSRVAAQLEQEGHSDIILGAEVELFLRISNTDALTSIESTEFQVTIEADGNDLRAVAGTDKNWAKGLGERN